MTRPPMSSASASRRGRWSRRRGVGVPAPPSSARTSRCQRCPFRYLVMEKARGVPLDLAGLAPDGQRAALRESGRLLARLHRIKVTGYGALSEQHFRETGAVMGRFAQWAVPSTLRAEAALNELYGAGALDVEEASGAMHLIEDEAATDVLEPSLLHDDFSARHTFVDPTQRRSHGDHRLRRPHGRAADLGPRRRLALERLPARPRRGRYRLPSSRGTKRRAARRCPGRGCAPTASCVCSSSPAATMRPGAQADYEGVRAAPRCAPGRGRPALALVAPATDAPYHLPEDCP